MVGRVNSRVLPFLSTSRMNVHGLTAKVGRILSRFMYTVQNRTTILVSKPKHGPVDATCFVLKHEQLNLSACFEVIKLSGSHSLFLLQLLKWFFSCSVAVPILSDLLNSTH